MELDFENFIESEASAPVLRQNSFFRVQELYNINEEGFEL
jgi:hypothetical protein